MTSLHRILILASAALAAHAARAIEVGQSDPFQSGTTLNWTGGASPSLVPNGGPLGDGDGYLRIQSSGFPGPSGNLAVHNAVQWQGDYGSAGIRMIEADVRNPGPSGLSLRIVLFTGFDGRWTSTTAVPVPGDGAWRRVRFPIDAESLTRVLGTHTYDQLIASVGQLMIRHQSGAPTSGGTPIEATLGIDNVTASAGRTVSGQVNLLDFVGAMPTSVLVEFRTHDSATTIQTEVAALDGTGQFTVWAPPVPGSYDASVKLSHWLRKTLPADTTPGNVAGLAFELTNGDVDGDNVVTVFDYNALSDAFDSAEGDANWNADADLDGDGSVTVFDYNVLSSGFDQSGDE